ncbi:MAG: hypothetical protein ACHQ4F_10740, partial [Candidatus Dormibacteria bacterium]
MRKTAGVAVLAMVCALAVPMLLNRPAAAFTPATLTWSGGTESGGPGTPLSYSYTWNTTDCTVSADSLQIQLFWDNPYEQVGSATVPAGTCSGSVTGAVPNDTVLGTHTPTASLFDNTTGIGVPNSEAIASSTFTVPPPPTPTPTPTPT